MRDTGRSGGSKNILSKGPVRRRAEVTTWKKKTLT